MVYMKRFFNVLSCAALLLLGAASCVTPRKVNYLQDMEPMTQIELENKFEAYISPYDELIIQVSAYDMELARPFNLQGGYGSSVGGSYSGNSGYGYTYLVDVNGNIQMPVLGEIHAAGLTRLQLQEYVEGLLRSGNYLEDPYVMVRFFNFKIFFLSSEGGGSITIPNERCTFLEALALKGGLDAFTRRDRIAVMREVDGKMTMRYLDPRSSEVFNDPYFMLQQNDFIITEQRKVKFLMNEVGYWGTLLSAVSMATSLATLVVTIINLGKR